MKIEVSLTVAMLLSATAAYAETQMWVVSDRVSRRTCPSTDCGIVGQLFFRESAQVAEVRSGWGRISRYYDAACRGGISPYVDAGRADCTKSNGIVDGRFAEWVQIDTLSDTRPDDPGASATGSAKLVAQSDDFRRFQGSFIRAANALIASGQCTEQDLIDTGGFIASTNKGPGIYFTYCRGGTDRIYLDVNSGQTFR